MADQTLHSSGPEWRADQAALDLVAIVNTLDDSRRVVGKLAYNNVNFTQIFYESERQAEEIEKMRALLFDAIKKINAVIEAKK